MEDKNILEKIRKRQGDLIFTAPEFKDPLKQKEWCAKMCNYYGKECLGCKVSECQHPHKRGMLNWFCALRDLIGFVSMTKWELDKIIFKKGKERMEFVYDKAKDELIKKRFVVGEKNDTHD